MGRDKGHAAAIRDAINGLIAAESGEGQESIAVICSLSVAVEGLEEWIYNGSFCPSVVPAQSVSDWKPSFGSFHKQDGANIPNDFVFNESMLTDIDRAGIADGKMDDVFVSIKSRWSIRDDVHEKMVLSVLRKYRSTMVENYLDRMTPQERDILNTDGKLLAIKAVRTRLGIGLKESKDIVERG